MAILEPFSSLRPFYRVSFLFVHSFVCFIYLFLGPVVHPVFSVFPVGPWHFKLMAYATGLVVGGVVSERLAG